MILVNKTITGLDSYRSFQLELLFLFTYLKSEKIVTGHRRGHYKCYLITKLNKYNLKKNKRILVN